MIQLAPLMRLLLAVEPVDRKGIDGLVQVCRQKLNTDPLAGALFVFANRRRKALKILVYTCSGDTSLAFFVGRVPSRGGTYNIIANFSPPFRGPGCR